ncbi:MAG TPA: RodZ domain-containing protein [Vicinamibacterales bacterium]|nr:RodZ domain-containing protein [Vicinamibacterales bacterium]
MEDFGGKLRQARERRGISLRQIAASTKISAAALEALERNDISKLPGGIFSRAFVRSYAAEVGLDPDETVEEFLDRFNQEAAPIAESVAANIPEEEADFRNKQRIATRFVTIAAIGIPLLIVISYFAIRGRSAKYQARLAQSTVAATTPEAPPPAPEPVPAAPVSDVGAVSAPAAARVTLDVHPKSECWVSLTIDGKKLFGRVMQAGERETHAFQREAIVEIGDAGAFAFAVNGREGKSLGDKGQVKTLKLTPATAAQYTR